MPRLLLVRHGRTQWNAERRYQGQTDVPLDAIGRAQVRALGERLADETLDAVFASTLGRAQSTAAAIMARHDLPIQPEPRLLEINVGAWEGLKQAEIEARYPEELAVWQEDPVRHGPPGGETVGQLAARARAVLDDLAERPDNESVLLVAHGGLLSTMIAVALGMDPRDRRRFRLEPASVSELWLVGGYGWLALLGDRLHTVGIE